MTKVCSRTGADSIGRGAACVEPLEARMFLSGGPSPLYAPHAMVRGESMQQWAVDWWQKIFAIPVYASDGKTIVNPQFDAPINPGDTVAAPHALPSDNGKAYFLFGSFSGGDINRTVTVPTGTPLLFSIINTEWSNPDTPAKPAFTSVPGNYTPKELAAYAKTEGNATDALSATLDGKPIANPFSYRDAATFNYSLPAKYNIPQVFFGENISGKVTGAALDGFFYMLKPLSPGRHVLTYSGHIPDLSGTPPFLGEFGDNVTYTINVVPKGKLAKQNLSVFSKQKIASDASGNSSFDDLLGKCKSPVEIE